MRTYIAPLKKFKNKKREIKTSQSLIKRRLRLKLKAMTKKKSNHGVNMKKKLTL
tara:strand:+ start:42 stop:203 length:162 start_codon:yes stop_codon:yes gene_type:complete